MKLLKRNKNRYRKIKEGELMQLIFWAGVGFQNARGGTYQRTAPKIVGKLAKRLNLNKQNFSGLGIRKGYLDSNLLLVLQKGKK